MLKESAKKLAALFGALIVDTATAADLAVCAPLTPWLAKRADP